jgi:putative ABC transport system ATP-binding protein
MQRRIAVALANRPPLLLDSRTGRAIMSLLRGQADREGVTAMVATHGPLLVDLADRLTVLSDGRVTRESYPETTVTSTQV